MEFHVITLFPAMLNALDAGLIGRARERNRNGAIAADADRNRTCLDNAPRGFLDAFEGIDDAARRELYVAAIDGAEKGDRHRAEDVEDPELGGPGARRREPREVPAMDGGDGEGDAPATLFITATRAFVSG